jgi:putative peptidoglycan lipid II flippase
MRDFGGQHVRLFGAALAVMLPLFILTQYLDWVGVELSSIARLGELATVMGAAIVGYLIAGKAAGVEEITMMRHLKNSVLRRPGTTE